ncbi:hypothetical protein H5J24_02540 [Chryseobacterium capnotolerans]|uniref:hypothetical protein n=1 Tax=Chryseobacterium TaxID=59732 RepID=UPI00083AEF62|nr:MULTISPECIES: hypothetical protein [Chryseobacterium]UHO39055.1 hypothetical protein H5J24_02540 [Chryseobacterium capnotolerans]
MKKNRNFNFLFLIIFSLIFITSCKNNNEKNIYFEKIENEQELQSAILFSVKNDSISIVKYNILKGFYNEQKKSFRYNDLNSLLKNLNNLSTKEKELLYFTKNLKKDNSLQELEDLSFNDKVKKLQLDRNSKNIYFVSASKYTKEELYSILYIFYKEQNYILYDDNIGKFLILQNLK